MKQTRVERINSEIRKEVSDIITNKINDPRVKGLVSLTKVDTSNDISHSKIYLSIFSGNKVQDEITFNAICSMASFIRKELAGRVDLRIIPELHFKLDNGFEESEKMNKIIDSLNIKQED